MEPRTLTEVSFFLLFVIFNGTSFAYMVYQRHLKFKDNIMDIPILFYQCLLNFMGNVTIVVYMFYRLIMTDIAFGIANVKEGGMFQFVYIVWIQINVLNMIMFQYYRYQQIFHREHIILERKSLIYTKFTQN